ncbi:MAG TPA: cell division protein ZipA C-terminal FtsZ-binding domain-containing protein [Candidatus Accumulibacter phosphatis]|nr:cell division protein ZipA C-terminal FtsZ-binding domain-containing protein [Candidatus Accumulibacter phosphatis]HRQ96720.1 cell division protein ZipA C-terminal FtsZ-binding domain-containing protein [Candidatus Accumulibacter phosphatis]
MTDLQMGLIGLGGVAVVGVLAYNKWQEVKHRKLAEQLLNARQADVLLDETGSGGSGGESRTASAARDAGDASAAAAGRTTRAASERVEPLLQQPDDAPAVSEVDGSAGVDDTAAPAGARRARIAAAPLCLLSPAIDYIAAIELSEPIAAYQIRDAQRVVLARLGKPLHWIGFNDESRAWEPIVEEGDGAYQHIRVGLQLVDRKGPLRDADLSVFHVAIQDLAIELMGAVELPLREPALQAAAQLDEFCAGVDIQIGINVVSHGQVFAGTKLRSLAESAGMVLDGEGRFVRRDEEGRLLYALLNQETQGFSGESIRSQTTHGVTFLLDVPRVANGDRVLSQMVEQARRFADALHGQLVDDNRRPLSESAIEPIRRQVLQYQLAMAHRQLPAGGPLAQRLFS